MDPEIQSRGRPNQETTDDTDHTDGEKSANSFIRVIRAIRGLHFRYARIHFANRFFLPYRIS
jgi:hypothetical protein